MADRPREKLERRLVRNSVVLLFIGAVAAWLLAGILHAASFLAGGVLAGINLLWLYRSVHAMFLEDPKRLRTRVLAGFLARLLLIPLCLYAMIRFLFLSLPAAVAGFAVFHCSVFIEGVIEAFEGGSK